MRNEIPTVRLRLGKKCCRDINASGCTSTSARTALNARSIFEDSSEDGTLRQDPVSSSDP